MRHFLKPARQINSLDELNLAECYREGIRGILIDLDNTISPWRQNKITAEAHELFRRASEQGIKVMLFTNATPERAKAAADTAGISCFPLAKKPFPCRYKKAIQSLGLSPQQILTIGDQIFTDTLGGNLAGCTTVLLPPLEATEYIGTKILRFMERLIGIRQKFRQ